VRVRAYAGFKKLASGGVVCVVVIVTAAET
jgi:hypothetical protein